jgi:hypothetical protein
MEEYVRGHVHTQGIENFWSLLKRSLAGTYMSAGAKMDHRAPRERRFVAV